MADDRVVKVVLSAEVREYLKGMEEASEKTKRAQEEATKLRERAKALEDMGKYALAFGGAMTVAAGAVAKTGIEYNTLQQTSRAALTTLLGSAEAANAQMDKLDEFARTSPFSKQVFIDAQQQLLGFGQEAERVVPTLDAVQNAVAATGGSNEDIAELVRIIAQLEGGVKISAETFNQFGTRGIDAAQLIGDAMGKTGQQIREEVTAGTLDADTAIQALTDGMSARFDGAAANVKDTFDGAMDRVKAAWRDLAAQLMEPLVDPNGGGLLIDLTNDVADFIRQVEALPEPVKMALGIIGALGGAASLAAGAFLLGAPKVVEFRKSLEVLGPKAQAAGRAVETAGKIAGGAAVFFTLAKGAEMAAGAFGMLGENVKSTNETMSLLLDQDFDGVFAGLSKGKDGVNDLESALDELLSSNWQDAFNRWGSDTFAFTGLESTVGKTRDQFELLGQSLADLVNRGEADQAKRLFGEIASVAEEQGYSVESLNELMPAYQDALKGVANEQKLAADGSGETAEGFDTVGASAEDAQKQVSELADAIRGFGSAELNVRDAHRAFEQAIDDLSESIEENGSSLDRSTESGRANEAAIDGMARRTLDLAAATFEQTQNEEDAARVIRDGRDALIEKLEAFGITGAEAEAYADKLGLIPDAAITQVKLEGTSEAEQQLDYLSRTRSVLMQVALNPGPELGRNPGDPGWGVLKPNADGGLYDYGTGMYAGGTPLYKFAEKETGWEAFISGKASERDRNVGIWMQAGERLGVLGGGGSGGQQITVEQHFNLPPGFTAGQIEGISGRGVQKALR